MYSITDWLELYEPKDKSRLTRGKPLKFVLVRRMAPTVGPGWMDLCRVAGRETFSAFGLFIKLLELAGSRPESDRDGRLADNNGAEADHNYIAQCTGRPIREINKLIPLLLEVNWIERKNATGASANGDSMTDASQKHDSGLSEERQEPVINTTGVRHFPTGTGLVHVPVTGPDRCTGTNVKPVPVGEGQAADDVRSAAPPRGLPSAGSPRPPDRPPVDPRSCAMHPNAWLSKFTDNVLGALQASQASRVNQRRSVMAWGKPVADRPDVRTAYERQVMAAAAEVAGDGTVDNRYAVMQIRAAKLLRGMGLEMERRPYCGKENVQPERVSQS